MTMVCNAFGQYFARIEARGLPIDCEATPHDPVRLCSTTLEKHMAG